MQTPHIYATIAAIEQLPPAPKIKYSLVLFEPYVKSHEKVRRQRNWSILLDPLTSFNNQSLQISNVPLCQRTWIPIARILQCISLKIAQELILIVCWSKFARCPDTVLIWISAKGSSGLPVRNYIKSSRQLRSLKKDIWQYLQRIH